MISLDLAEIQNTTLGLHFRGIYTCEYALSQRLCVCVCVGGGGHGEHRGDSTQRRRSGHRMNAHTHTHTHRLTSES